ATIRAIVLVESLPCVYQMEEMLYELGPYAAGLNAERWDLKASIFEFVMTDPRQVWPDRFGVDIKTTPFLADIFRRLVAICQKRGAVPVGGMATALPSNDPEVNRVAGEAIRKDKEWEAGQARHPPGAHGGPSDRSHVRGADRPAHPAPGQGLADGRAARRRAGEAPPRGGAGRHPRTEAEARRRRGAVPQGREDRHALGEELHGARLSQPRLVLARRARRHRRRPRRALSRRGRAKRRVTRSG